ncbi:MAG: efflux RND transporter permease subunit [Magnetococcales bacterium]|nr:efflux RND transporter permease subunit [Magnetococcales bacterium]
MNLPVFFVRRPVTTVLIMVGWLIFGVLGYFMLPVSALPNVDFPTIQVSAALSGTSPETMAAAVASPLEKQFSSIAGLDSMSSTSSLGGTQITLQFALSRNIDGASQDVLSAISQAQRYLPPNMSQPPSYRKVNPADMPIFYMAVTSDTLPLTTVNEYADTALAQRISMIDGVAQVTIFGSQRYAMRIKLDPNALAARGIGLDEVQKAIDGSNVNVPTGALYGRDRVVTIKGTGDIADPASYRRIIVAYRNGAAVHLDEVGRVVEAAEDDKASAWFNDKQGMVLAILRQPGANTIAVVDAIRSLLPTIRQQIPAGIEMTVLYDRSESIRESVRDVQWSLLLALVLVVFVIFLFLRNLSATIIPSLALPMSIVGTFPVMYFFGFSIDNLSLMALTLCVGFVVDDAIVMLENIARHVEQGKEPLQATLDGATEVGFTILSMTLSLAAVFIPVLFMGGILGRLLHEFAVTIMAAVLISGFVSLSLTPMLCSRYLRAAPAGGEAHGVLYRWSESFFNALQRGYDRSLRLVLRHSLLTMVIFVGVLALTFWVGAGMPTGFLPIEDTGQLLCFTEAEQDVGYDAMLERQLRIAEIVRADPGVAAAMAFVGAGGSSQSINLGRIFMRLKPRSERDKADVILQRLRPKLASVPGIRAYLQNLPTIRIGGVLTKSQYQYTLKGSDTDELFAWAPKLEARLRTLPGFVNVTSDLQINKPQILVEIDRDKAARLNLNPRQIEAALTYAYSGAQVSTIYGTANEYQVILELDRPFQNDPTVLSLLKIRTPNGSLVPLDTVARLSRGVGPSSITHVGQLPAVTLSFDLQPGYALSDAIKAIDVVQAEMQMPISITASFQGAAQAFQDSMAGMGWLLMLAILVIYLILGMLYESYIHPVTILSGLPSAGLGALLTLKFFHLELDMYGFVGLIMLVGIVKKNAIMMIDFALEAQRQQEGITAREAIYQAALIRFRPIMMTTMAALMGAVPIAAGWGAGGEGRRTLGLAVVGGLLLSQWLTLYFTPVIYHYFDRLQQWRHKAGAR